MDTPRPSAPLRVLRWGRAEYEVGPLVGLPDDVEVIEAVGEGAPLEDADVIVVPSKVRIGAGLVQRLRRCRLVITTTSGYDHLDVHALRAAGVRCARLPLARRDAVVQTALGMMLSLTRRFGPLQEAAREGRWERDRLDAVGATLLGTVGVVGAGVIGRRMMEALEGLGARVLVTDPLLPESVSIETLLAEANVVTLHCALNAENARMIRAETIDRMRPGAVLVNTARGRLVDLDDAMAAMRAGRLAGLGLDVFPEEPAPLANLAHPAVLLTPHAAGWHPGLGGAIADGVSAAVSALRAGRPIPYAL